MENKEKYTLLDMTVIEFESADVIVTSVDLEDNEIPAVSYSNP